VWGREGRRRNFWVPSLPVSESEGLRVLKKSERDGMVGGGEARRGGGKTTTRRRAECGSGSGESDVWRSHQLSPAEAQKVFAPPFSGSGALVFSPRIFK
jgi:hypothetical protein